MRILFLSMLVITGLCVDECLQLTTYDKCIGIQNLQCYWTGQYCRNSNNYLLGCEANLSLTLCIKQLGDMSGKVSKCVFDTYCHEIYDNYNLKCSDNLSKSGCLSITNPSEHCKWLKGNCLSLTNDELNSLNTIFGQLELSASNCGLISGYLIIHNSILWDLIDYTPDLYTEAQNNVDIEAGLEVTSTKYYDDSATLQDNFIDSSGIFHWYTKTTQLSAVYIQINDYTRYGCIAQEILTETRFSMLFSLNGIIRGVNHIYCNYLNKHPSNPITTVFINNECVQIPEQQLQNQSFIEENTIVCNSMSGLVCQRFYHPNTMCKINFINEYECNSIGSITKPTSCEPLAGLATHYDCVQVDSNSCYLETQSTQAYCSNECSDIRSQTDCEASSNCVWLGSNLNNITNASSSQFIVCSPIKGCNQLGLNEKFCKSIAMNCYWDDTSMKCKSITHIEQLKCTDCNTLYCCSSIIRYDQFCIWSKDQCLNTKDQPLFSHFLSFPTSVVMNFNLCVSQSKQYNYYEKYTRTCQTDGVDLYIPCVKYDDPNYKIDNYQCNNGQNDRINKEYCLSLINSYTRWDEFRLQCLHVVNTNVDCDSLKLVNPNICRLAKVESTKFCLYNKNQWSCYSSNSTILTCDTKGINKEQCTDISDQYCQWVNNQCKKFQPHDIQTLNCSDLTNVSQKVCQMANLVTDQCKYDANQSACIINHINVTTCSGNWNFVACQNSSAKCYFDNVSYTCLDATLFLNQLTCDTEYISQATCLAISTKNQRCFWGSLPGSSSVKCRSYTAEFYSTCDSYNGTSNSNLCSALTTNISLNLTNNQYCEIVNSSCVSAITTISDSDCGYNNRIINVYRCMGYTTGQCYFNNYKCTPLQGPIQYQQLLLTQLTCDQSNINICPLILTPGQACFKETGQKCNLLYTQINYACATLATYDMSVYGPQLCIRASDACYFNKISNQCTIPDSSDIFECNQIGASQIVCLTQTKGLCAFINYYCQPLKDLTTACPLRNKQACTYGTLNCIWNTAKSICSLSTELCPASYSDKAAWPICGVSSSNCFAGKNGCVQSFSYYTPCWLSLSSQSCNQQTKYCQWINDKCTDTEYSCEDAKTLSDCILHRSRKCVYNDNKCFEITNPDLYNCDDFEYTTDLFCRWYYPVCAYSSSYICSIKFLIADSKQTDQSYQQQGCLSFSHGASSCLLQRALLCRAEITSYDVTCYDSTYSTQGQCENFSQTDPQSILSCEGVENCGFGLTLSGETFCHTLPLACEQLSETFCLKDIPGINCYYDYHTLSCQTYKGPYDCISVQFMAVNKQLCLTIMETSQLIQCYYDPISQGCKPLTATSSDGNCDSKFDIYACTFAKIPCLNTYNADDTFLLCTSPSNSFNKDLNHVGCALLTDNNYFFNLNKYKCSLYSADQNDQIFICQQLNENLCKSLTLNPPCVWHSNQCQLYLKQFENIDCQYRNLQACIKSTNLNCIWYINSCISYDGFTGDCSSNSCIFSERSCNSQNQLWDGSQCYTYSSLPISFYKCDKLGLNQDLCLNKTSDLTCYWDGFKCLQANLLTIQCSDNVSQQTCQSIITPKQTCKWINNQCVNKYNSLNCSDFINLNSCRQAKIICQFNNASKLCVAKNDIDQFCSSSLSYGACQTVELEYCMWNDGYCQKWKRQQYSCNQIVNKWGCYNTSMYCKWTDKCENLDSIEPMPCQSIPSTFNKVSCSKFSTGPCNFDEINQRCDIKLTSAFQNSLDADQTQFTQIRLIYECTQFTNSEDCIQSRIGQCEWLNNQCLNCTISQCSSGICSNQNQNQCMILDYECAWRNNRCISWIYDSSYVLSQLSLVTEKCCSRLNMLIKYDQNLQSCVPLNVAVDDCNTLGLSKYACLHLVYSQCIFKANSCQQYIFQQQSKCTDYQNVTSYVCQQLPHLSCKYDFINYQCVEIDENNDQCKTIGLSLLGCTNINSQPCYWKGTYCSYLIPNINVNQCDNYTKTNSFACQQLNYYSVCSYNQEQRACQPRFNKYSQCSEPGLNRLACLNIIREPCQYINNQCQIVTSFTSPCNDLRDVNELACKINSKDSCAYDPIAKNCFFTLQQLPCTFPGLNKISCLNQQFCSWSSDIYKCQCNALSTSSVCSLTVSLCKSSDSCKYEKQGGYCRIRYCDDLSDCTGFASGQRCYLNHNLQCQGATQCEDIVNLVSSQSCTEYTFNGSTCIQLLNYCVSASNLEQVCINSDCTNTLCKMSNSICQPITCSDYYSDDCRYYAGCSLVENTCKQITTCSDIKDYDNCVNARVGTMKCSWEFTGIYEDTYHCTSTYCQLYNVSPTLCNGNEINLHSCFMDQFQQCRVCEEITDQCTCSNSNGSCIYNNGICQSILCSSFLNKLDCQDIKKCYWSSNDNVCRKYCFQIIKQEECEALNYECHWNSYQYKCEQGVAVSPDLSVTIVVQDIFAILINPILIYLI